MTGRRVLVVEDEPSMRLLIERVLSRAGWEVVAVDGVQQAMPWVDSVEVVVADYFLREDRGSRLAEHARDELGIFSPPILLVTATPGAVQSDEWPLFADHLPKPFRIAALVDKVEALAGERKRARSGVEMKAVDEQDDDRATG